MEVSCLELLDLYTEDRNISQEILNNYEKNIHNILNLKLEEKLRVLPYVEKLRNKYLNVIKPLFNNEVSKEVAEMCTYLFIRSKLGPLMNINILTQAVVNKVNSLFIDRFPSKLPLLIENGIYIEARELILFDDISKIILYNEKSANNTDRFGIILIKTDGTFDYSSIEYSYILGKVAEDLDYIDYKGKTNNTDIIPFRKALMFCFMFAILLKADNTPVLIKDIEKSHNLKGKNVNIINNKKNINGWIVRTVYINNKSKKNNNIIHATLYKDDKLLKKVIVSGFLRYQAIGKNYSEHKYVYIDSFTSYRWVTEGDKKIIYYLKE